MRDKHFAGERQLMSFWELVFLLVMSTGIVALSIDMMLPALPQIATDLELAEENHRQYVVTAFLVGFGFAQLIYGPLSDAWGRKPVILGALILYIAATAICSLAWSFESLLAGRFLQGMTIAAARVVGTAVARDLTSGRRMAQVVSVAMMVFMAVPVIAPSLGQLMLFIVPWRGIFWFLLIAAGALALWLAYKLPETLPEEYRRELNFGQSMALFRDTLRHRQLVGYMLSGAFFFGGLYGMLGSSEQLLAEHFQLGTSWTIAFAIMAGCMAITNFVNSRLVIRYGQRRLSQGALIGFFTISAGHTALILIGLDNLYLFLTLLTMAMMLMGLIAANFNALAMEPVGHIAGTASAVYGFGTGVIGAAIGATIGQLYNDTTLPLIAGQTLTGLAAFGVVYLTERGELFGEGTDDGETAHGV
ncbi:multidrug effflux MFS transporter [Hyphobacterium sp.]|uniref:multidrug effflux MFS transporter n=1 Tax=Hyphobacterium sp. TaxID=2004662 RepID=UPI003BABE494